VSSVEVVSLRPDSAVEWRVAEDLINELIEWDVQKSEGLGFTREEVISAFYPDSMASIRRNSEGPDGCFLLATEENGAAGCAAYRRLDSETCELYDIYVRRSYRGSGIGSLLVKRLRREAMAAGYKSMYLETATFMVDAHRLYQSHEFNVREHYRAVPVNLRAAIISMECVLGERVARASVHEA
jgi:ribosomal protein S18 acetylase RimI-like enzyme